jgi:hypothetical protein
MPEVKHEFQDELVEILKEQEDMVLDQEEKCTQAELYKSSRNDME